MTVLVFDIETVPDINVGAKIHGLEGLPAEDIERAMVHIQCQKNGSEFLPLHLHQVVAIAVARWSAEDGLKILSLGDLPVNESELIRQFFAGIDKYKPRIVSWNGGGFDLPVLHYRTLLHGIAAPTYWETGDKEHAFRYNNYLSRYHWRHLDLMDKLAQYHPQAFAPLDQIAKMLGFPGKQGIGGEHVADAWRAGKIEEIRNYCEIDVLNTYLIYLRFELIRGELSAEEYSNRINQVRDTLNTSEKEHWQTYLKDWDLIE